MPLELLVAHEPVVLASALTLAALLLWLGATVGSAARSRGKPLSSALFAKPMSGRALLLWAIDDRPTAASFRSSLFGETQPVATTADRASHPARMS